MSETLRRVGMVGAVAVFAVMSLAPPAAAQSSGGDAVHNARRLGGSTSFYAPPLRSAASLKQMMAKKGMADDIRTVLRDAGIPETADAVLAALATATSVKGGSCDMATPADGTLVECDFQTGASMVWMAYRPGARQGNRAPGRLERVRWAGPRPFKALLFRVTNDYKIYTFVLPFACANLSLVSMTEIEGAPVDVAADRTCDPKTGFMRATIRASSKDLERVSRVSVTIDGQPAGELVAPSWTFVASKPGTYTFDATDRKGRSYPMARRSLVLDACPPPPPEPKKVVAPTCGIALSFFPVKRAYEIRIDARGSSTGTSEAVASVTVELRDGTGALVGPALVMDDSRAGTVVVRRPGTYRATATVATPRAVEVGSNRYEGSATCEASVDVVKTPVGASVFFDLLGGKERRVRPNGNTNLEFAQCSPLAGAKVGVARRLATNWEVTGAVGAAISLVTSDDKVRESALFVDAEINRHLGSGAFVGTGVSLWDLTRSDTITPAWLLHLGLPLSRTSRHPIYFIAEGRMFFDNIDNVSSNYLIWGGVRVYLNGR